MKQWETMLSPPAGTGSSSTSGSYPSYSGSGNGAAISLRGMLVFFLSLACMAAIAYFCYGKIQALSDGHYAGSATRMIMFDISYVPPKGRKTPFGDLKSAMSGRFRQRYGELFASNTPWDELYRDCTPGRRGCLLDPYKGVENLRSFALKPATVMEDICAINARDYHTTPIDFLVKPVWRVEFEEPGKWPGHHLCVVENGDAYIERVRIIVPLMQWGYRILGVLASILCVAGIKKTFHRRKPG